MNNRLKMRRLHEVLIVIVFVIILLTIGSKWTSSTRTLVVTDNSKDWNARINRPPNNPFLPHEKLSDTNDNPVHEQLTSGSDNLAKYIHLDLKGAPPQADQFYENFFNFVDKLQMGVKGILIEYEDMLPLEGRLQNVSATKERSSLLIVFFSCRPHIVYAIPNPILN
jgi:hypothetical protein